MEDILFVSIPVTIIILALSVVYSWNNLTRLWKDGDPKKSCGMSDIGAESDKPNNCSENTENVDMRGGGDNSSSDPLMELDADPYEYCGHIQSQVKKARQRVATREIRQNLSANDIEAEREAQRKQLEDIFKLMEKQNNKFGMESMDEVKEQMKLYC